MESWANYSSGADWGLDLLSQPNGLFGDLNDASHPKGDMDPACKPGEIVDQMAYSPQSEGPLDFEWMESGDLGSFLESLDNGQSRLSLQDGLLEDGTLGFDLKKDNISVIEGQNKLFSIVNGGDVVGLNGLTPPESPEQVIPVIKLDPEINDQLWTQTIIPSNVGPTQNFVFSVEEFNTVPEQTPVLIQSPVDFLENPVDLKPELFGVEDILGLPFVVPDSASGFELVDSNTVVAETTYSYSSDEGSSILSPSGSPSPRPSIDSLIQSSPELYKVIATPSDLSVRFSPYSKSKGDHNKAKAGSSKAKSKAEKQFSELLSEDEVEEFIPSHLGKKERKKLQNKNAAIRYRQKKKAEVECIFTEVQGLEDKNSDLKSKVDDLQREVKYMKSLMEDIYKAKGLVKK